GRIGEAIQTAQKATRLDPTSANAFAELTRALSWAGQTDPAIQAGEKAISIDAQNATAHAFLAEAYLRAGRTNDAQQMVDKALELDDANPETHRAAGWVAILSGRKDEGVGEWHRTIELAPDIFLFHYELGLVYANHLDDPESAIGAFQDAIRLYPPYIPSYTALGRAYLASNQPAPAILQFQKALTLDPNSSDAFLGLGQAFQLTQKCPQAIPYFQKALELNKELVAATKGLEDCGAIAKGSVEAQPPPTQVVLAPVATAIPQATVAPIGNSNPPPANPSPQIAPLTTNHGAGRIYFPLYDGQYHIYSANPDGSDRRIVVELASSPSVNQDGSSMLFYSWVSDQRGIHRIGTNGAGDIHISLRAEDTLPSWSPDGSKYVYTTRAGLGGDINKRAYALRVSSTGGKPRQDPNSIVTQAQYPTWGPNNKIVFRDCGYPGDVCGLAVANPDGTGKVSITNINSTAPAWSPDGKNIVFMSNAAGNWDLYVVSADGGSPQRLTDDFGDDGLPTYSPDGSKIAFVAYREGKWAVWQMDTDGENEKKLFDIGGEIAGNVPGNAPTQPGQVWIEQRISWR
ncbi:MAG TPA: tetratricopeptide repeat protein, partial [Anaerolineae bacterium]|nr:tetratricopeptide repeat protein [Anaerolineae bacterium]